MKKFLIEISIFIPFALVVYMCLLFLLGNSSHIPGYLKKNLTYTPLGIGHIYTRLKEVKKTSNIDILFLGSSHAYFSFDPRIFASKGYTSFILGSAGQSHLETQVLIKRYLERLNPRLVVYEVYPQTFDNDGVGSSRDLLSNDVNDIYSLIMTLKINHIKTYNTFLYSSSLDILGLKKEIEEPLKRDYTHYITGGFVEQDLFYYTPKTLPEKKIKINPKQLEAFQESLKLMTKKGIPVILVYAPMPPSNYNRYTNNEEFDTKMSELGTYYNFNKILSLKDASHFSDYHHLNQKGIKIFDSALINIIEKYTLRN